MTATDPRPGPPILQNRKTAVWVGVLFALWVAVYAVRFFHYSELDPDTNNLGNLATALRHGLAAPLDCYRANNAAGTLTYGVLLAPVFYFFGSKYVWVKLLGGLFVLGGVVFWTLAVHHVRRFSAAAMFLLFFTFPPPGLERDFHIWVLGSHLECMFFSGLLTWLILRQGDDAPTYLAGAALGLVAGYAAFFSPQNLALGAAAAAIVVWRWRWKGAVRALLPGAVCYALLVRQPAAQHLAAGPERRVFAKLADLFVRRLPDFAAYDATIISPVKELVAHWNVSSPGGHLAAAPLLSYLFYGCFLLGLAWAIVKALTPENTRGAAAPDKWLLRLLAAQLTVWLAAYSLSGHPFEFRYLLPIYPAIVAIVVLLVHALPRGIRWPAATPFLVVGLCNVLTPLPQAATMADNWRRMANWRGDNFAQFAYVALGRYWQGDFARQAASVAKLPPAWRDWAWAGFGAASPPAEILAALDDDPAWRVAGRNAIAFGAGVGVGGRVRQTYIDTSGAQAEELRHELAAAAASAARLEPEAATEFAAGVGYGFGGIDLAAGGFESLVRRALAEGAGRDNEAAPAPGIRQLFAMVPQLEAGAALLAFVRGQGLLWGRNPTAWKSADAQKFVAFWAHAFAVEPSPELAAAWRRGFYEGKALHLMSTCNRFTNDDDPASFALLREALADRGVALRPAGTNPNEYALDAMQ